jgi:protein gp37
MVDQPPGKPNAIKGWIPRAAEFREPSHFRDACFKAGFAFFWKKWSGAAAESARYILDGREWSEQPRTLGEDGRWRDSVR